MRPREQVAHIDEGMRIVVLRFVNVKAQQWRPHPIETKAFEELVVDAARRALVTLPMVDIAIDGVEDGFNDMRKAVLPFSPIEDNLIIHAAIAISVCRRAPCTRTAPVP